MELDLIQLGKRIKKRRKKLNLKQNELAEKLDISNNHISAIETGKQCPSLKLLIEICQELQTTPDFLLLGCMRSNNVPQELLASLRLCSEKDIQIIKTLTELLIDQNAEP